MKFIQLIKLKSSTLGNSNNQPYCHGKDSQDFYTATKDFYDAFKKDPNVINNYEIKMVTKVNSIMNFDLDLELLRL